MYKPPPPLSPLLSNAILSSASHDVDEGNDSVFDDGTNADDQSDDERSDIQRAVATTTTKPGVWEEEREVRALAKNETRRVALFKLLVVVSILLAAGIVSAGTFVFLKDEDDSEFDDNVCRKSC
jgi:hypothetical protein